MDKYPFPDLLQQHNVSVKRIADLSGVMPETVERMQEGRPVLKDAAEKVLQAFFKLTGQDYTLENVDVNIYMIAVTSEVARLMSQIEDEYTSAKLGLQGLSQWTAKHAFMTAKQERIANQMNELGERIGEEATAQFFMNLDVKPEQEGNIQGNG